MDDEIRQLAIEAITVQCPHDWASDRERVVEVGLRRWHSFERRSGRRRSATRTHQVADLAKGLRDALDPRPDLVGPDMAIYHSLAEAIASVLAPEVPAAKPSPPHTVEPDSLVTPPYTADHAPPSPPIF